MSDQKKNVAEGLKTEISSPPATLTEKVSALEAEVERMKATRKPHESPPVTTRERLSRLTEQIQQSCLDAKYHWNAAAGHFEKGDAMRGKAEQCRAEALDCATHRLDTIFNMLVWEDVNA